MPLFCRHFDAFQKINRNFAGIIHKIYMSQITISAALSKKLTKPQQEFNRLTEKINELRAMIEDFQAAVPRVYARSKQEISPLVAEYRNQFYELVRLYDKMYEHPQLKSQDRKKIQQIILQMLGDQLGELSDDMVDIYNKHSGGSYDEDKEEEEAYQVEVLKAMATKMYGIHFDPKVDIDTIEKVKEYIANYQQPSSEHETDFERKKAEHRANNKSARQAAKDKKIAEKQAKRAEEAKKVTKSVREVYMDLVKTFHPDLEKDESEKGRKTAIMQRVTAAYESNDLLTLLQLQMEFERMDDEQLSAMPDDRILTYNKILRNQTSELIAELEQVKEELASITNRMPHEVKSTAILDHWLNQDIKTTKKALKEVKDDLKSLSDPAYMKAWLKYV